MVDTGDCGWLISRKDCMLGRRRGRRRRRVDEELIYGGERLQRELFVEPSCDAFCPQSKQELNFAGK